MFSLINRKSLIAAALVLGVWGGSSEIAAACDAPRCYWRTVTEYVAQEVPYVRYITRYDHCGKPYQVEIVGYRTVQVPVQRRVKVCY